MSSRCVSSIYTANIYTPRRICLANMRPRDLTRLTRQSVDNTDCDEEKRAWRERTNGRSISLILRCRACKIIWMLRVAGAHMVVSISLLREFMQITLIDSRRVRRATPARPAAVLLFIPRDGLHTKFYLALKPSPSFSLPPPCHVER